MQHQLYRYAFFVILSQGILKTESRFCPSWLQMYLFLSVNNQRQLFEFADMFLSCNKKHIDKYILHIYNVNVIRLFMVESSIE